MREPTRSLASAREPTGIDGSLIVEFLALSPGERLLRNEQASADVQRLQAAFEAARRDQGPPRRG
jgi:hypothetical protein